MNGRSWILVVGLLVAVIRVPGIAQEPDARTLMQTSLRAMGAENLKSITVFRDDRLCRRAGPELFPGERLAREPVDQLHADHRLRREVLEAGLHPAAGNRPGRTCRRRQRARDHKPARRGAAARYRWSAATSPGT